MDNCVLMIEISDHRVFLTVSKLAVKMGGLHITLGKFVT